MEEINILIEKSSFYKIVIGCRDLSASSVFHHFLHFFAFSRKD